MNEAHYWFSNSSMRINHTAQTPNLTKVVVFFTRVFGTILRKYSQSNMGIKSKIKRIKSIFLG